MKAKIDNIMKETSKKGGIKMRKMISVVMALAMIMSFLPIAMAQDSAQLSLSVTFDTNYVPLTIKTDPEGPFNVAEDVGLKFSVIADGTTKYENIRLTSSELPKGAMFLVMGIIPNPDPSHAEGIFTWTPEIGQAQDAPYVVAFYASIDRDHNGVIDEKEQVKLAVQIYVAKGRIISIELNETSWVLQGVKLGEWRDNLLVSTDGIQRPIHNIANTGTVAVSLDIGYIPQAEPLFGSYIRPGDRTGLDTYVTALGQADPSAAFQRVIPPSCEKISIVRSLAPETRIPLALAYGAPTALTSPVNGMGASYEIRAYPNLIIVEPPPYPVPYPNPMPLATDKE